MVLDEAQVDAAMRWAELSGHFPGPERTRFHRFLRLIQPTCSAPDCVSGKSRIDEGNFGTIEAASFAPPGQEPRKVAIKYVKPHQRAHSHSQESKSFCNIISELKLECEALLVLPTRHPNVAGLEGVIAQFPAHDGALQDLALGLVFEMCSGGNLHSFLHHKNKELHDELRLSMMCDVASGLAFLHSVRLLHRDLSSRNLLVAHDNTVKIADFGTARVVVSDKYEPSTISGSPPWMSPEQINGGALTLKSDVFSLGSILWEVSTSSIPFAGVDDLDRIRADINKKPPKLQPLGQEALKAADVREACQRLVTLCHEQEECFRPSAEAAHGIVKALRDASPAEARDVLVPIRKRVKRNTEQHVAPPFSCAAAYSAMLTEQEHRSVLGKRMWNFYIKHNQERLPVLGPVIDHFAKRVDAFNIEVRKKYKADLDSEQELKKGLAPASAWSTES